MIGILTFQFAHNYGAQLQAYALRKYLISNNYKAEIINYLPRRIYDSYNIKVSIKDLINNPKKFYIKFRTHNQSKLFNNFINKYLKCESGFSEVTQNVVGKYSYIIFGSDQIWNLDITNNDLTYFGNNIEGTSKISYAASIGDSTATEKWDNIIINDLKKFDYISVREATAKQTIEQFITNKVYQVCDPVFLLKKQDWSYISVKPDKFYYKKYILFYALTEDRVLINEAIKLSKEIKLPIISIHPMVKSWNNRFHNLNNVGPCEFLWLINNAEYVVTNSFHGTAFSIIYKKKAILSYSDSIGERNMDLLRMLYITPYKYIKINFENCKFNQLDTCVEESKKYLNKALI